MQINQDIEKRKFCTKCQKWKSRDEFTGNRKTKDGKFSWCKPCWGEYNQTYRAKNVEKIRKLKTEWWMKNKERLSEKYKEFIVKNPQYKRDYNRKYRQERPFYWIRKKYGLLEDEFLDMLSRQNNKCGICGTDFSKCRLTVDHDHLRGHVSGLLCNNCNLGIGLLRDKYSLIMAMMYLEGDSRRD